MSVDSITDLSDNASKLLEALQLSHPHELDPRRSLGKEMLSLNPLTWQVPRIVDRCCEHIEAHGKYACLHGGLVDPSHVVGWGVLVADGRRQPIPGAGHIPQKPARESPQG